LETNLIVFSRFQKFDHKEVGKMAKIRRNIGGAGTGKTRLILDSLSEAKAEMGLGVHQIGFATFTRAGRAEIAHRAAEAWGVDPEALTRTGWFRTAHSIAHRQCGVADGQLIQGQDGDDWTSKAVGGKVASKSDARGDRNYIVSDSDPTVALSLKAWELARSRMTSIETVINRLEECGEQAPGVPDARRVIAAYESAKNRESRLDFTDMIARFAGVRFHVDGPMDCEPEGSPPEGLRILAIDEAQDSSTLVDRVCRRLASSPGVERIWLTGDPYQSIHSFAGGDYRHFLSWDAEESIMPRSYRCPTAVLTLGEKCLRQMKSGYRDRKIMPASHDGSVGRVGGIEEAISRLRPDSSALILGRCTYALEEYEATLIARGLPYAWADKAGPSAALSGYAALWDLQHGRTITGDAWSGAVQQIAVKHADYGDLLTRGAKAAWKDGRMSNIDLIRPVDEDFALIGATPALQKLIATGRWNLAMESKSLDKADRWLATATKYGQDAATNPKIRLSTIHGAKGLEADTVICSSITSPSVERGRLNMDDLHDEECRVAYVAVTRARRDFLLVDDGNRYRMELPL
jgi:superfamily I DNA/RNA helicase